MTFADFAVLLTRILNFQIFSLSGQPITIIDLATFALFVTVTLVVSRILRRSARAAMDRRGIDDPGTRAITERLLHWLVLIAGLGTAIQNVGINLGAIFAAGAVFAVGIGFALQSVAQNFLSGIILLLERSIKPGDVLEVDGHVVQVEAMRMRSTVARTRDDEQLIIPNTLLAQGTVKNYTMEDSYFRVTLDVGVAYDSDMKVAREALERAADTLTWKAEGRPPQVYMIRFGSSSVDFSVAVWTDDPWRARRAESDLHEVIWYGLKNAGVTIAFPQIDVHFDPVVDETLTRWRKAS